MYRVKADNITIYDDVHLAESLKVISPKLTLKDNSAGSFEITLPPGNAGYNTVERLSTIITVYRDGNEIWEGRVIQEKKDLWNNRILTCEGELAYLNDSTQPPAKYENYTVYAFLSAILAQHNAKVGTDKRFTIGTVTVNETIDRFTNSEVTLETISEKLVNRLGGHLRIRKVGTTRYLDYLQDWPSTNSQEIRFGQNLLDFTRNWDETRFATVVVPRGIKLDESPIPELEAYLDVTSVNAGSRYVTNEEGISEFGWIETVIDWGDIETASELKAKAVAYLEDQQFDEMIVQVSAVDLRYLGITADSIQLLDEVRCISRPHGMDRIFPVSELSIQLDKPDASTYILGDAVQNTLTASSRAANQSIINRIDGQTTAQQTLQAAKDNASQLINSATRGYVTIVQSSNGTQSLAISSDLTYNPNTNLWSTQTKLWRWNINGLGYSTDGGRSFGTAITIDGAIVANYITTGTMSADRVRTGILQSQDGNVVWNLNSGGSLTINRGSISLGSGAFSVDNLGYLTASSGVIGGFTITSWSIYNDTLGLSNDGLRMNRDGVSIGKFGTNNMSDHPSQRGMVMDLEYTGNYITWASLDTASAGYYNMKLTYVGKNRSVSGFTSDRLTFGCDIDGNNWLAHRFWINPNDGGINGGLSSSGKCYIPASINSSGQVTSYYQVEIVNGVILPWS